MEIFLFHEFVMRAEFDDLTIVDDHAVVRGADDRARWLRFYHYRIVNLVGCFNDRDGRDGRLLAD